MKYKTDVFPDASRGDCGQISDIMALGLIVTAAAFVAFLLPTGSGLIVGAVALFACVMFGAIRSNRRGQDKSAERPR